MTAEVEEWGDERMILAAESARQPSAADRFTCNAPRHDDMTLLVIQLG
jgi:hypothetical protein